MFPSQNSLIYTLTGAIKVTDFTASVYFAAKANATVDPMECATKWKEFNSKGNITDFSIISRWSFRVYKQPGGLGLLPNPNKSTANNLYFCFASPDKLQKTVSVQNEDEEMKPCKNITFSIDFPSKFPSRAAIKHNETSIRNQPSNSRIFLLFAFFNYFCNKIQKELSNVDRNPFFLEHILAAQHPVIADRFGLYIAIQFNLISSSFTEMFRDCWEN